ncbi:unnamed protein product, partial [Phaeothamnion confervicola]
MWLLVVPLYFGWVLARRVYQTQVWYSVLGLSIALPCALFLEAVNLLCHWIPVSQASYVVSTLMLLCALWLQRRLPTSPIVMPPKKVTLWLVTFSSLIWVYTTVCQNTSPDDDYWIHTPIEARLAYAKEANPGGITIPHPFFPDIQMSGHYGRDLLVAALSSYTHKDVYFTQVWLTSVLSLATFLILYGLVE